MFGFVWGDFVRAFWPFPRAFGSLLPEVLQEAVEKNRVMSSKDLADLRAKWFKNGCPEPKLWQPMKLNLNKV